MEFERDKRFVSGRLRSLVFAWRGAVKLVTTEHSVMVQSVIALIMVVAGFVFDISRTEWMMQILATGLVIGIESLNTAIEKIADFVHPGFHEKIGFIKDISAGAVFLAALAAIAVGLLIYVPKFI